MHLNTDEANGIVFVETFIKPLAYNGKVKNPQSGFQS